MREGETFFIPPNVPHAPVRPPDTIGVVVEKRRPPGEHEHVIFYCEKCGALVEDIDFDCADIVEHFSKAMLDFWNDDARRTCKKCGTKVPQPQPVEPTESDESEAPAPSPSAQVHTYNDAKGDSTWNGEAVAYARKQLAGVKSVVLQGSSMGDPAVWERPASLDLNTAMNAARE